MGDKTKIETVEDLYNLLGDHKRKLSVRISSRAARQQTAEAIRAVEYVEQLNAVVIFTEEVGSDE